MLLVTDTWLYKLPIKNKNGMFAETEKLCEQNGMVLVAKQKQQKRRGKMAYMPIYRFITSLPLCWKSTFFHKCCIIYYTCEI